MIYEGFTTDLQTIYDYFFWAKYDDLARIVGDALDSALDEGGAS